MTRALSFVRAYFQRRRHCRETGHEPRTERLFGRVIRLECDCGTTFWERW